MVPIFQGGCIGIIEGSEVGFKFGGLFLFFSFSKQDDTSSLLLWRGLKDRQEVEVIESFEWSLQILEGGECRTVAHQICNLRTM